MTNLPFCFQLGCPEKSSRANNSVSGVSDTSIVSNHDVAQDNNSISRHCGINDNANGGHIDNRTDNEDDTCASGIGTDNDPALL